MSSKRTPALSTAALVVKGAAVAVLGIRTGRTTVGCHFSEGNRARLTLNLAGKYEDIPSEELRAQLARAAVAKVEEDVVVYMFEMARSEAEKTYGEAMYDKANVPSSVKLIKIAYIEGFAFNCAPSEHVASTGKVGKLTMTKVKWRKSKKELEIQFEIEPTEDAEGGKNKSCAAPERSAIDAMGTQPFVEAAPASGGGGTVINPWKVEADDGGVDYDKVVKDFGSTLIDSALIERFERITGKRPHPWLRRGIFYSHRDMNKILDL